MGAGVVGLDLSIRHPAGCYLPGDWRPGDWDGVAVKAWELPTYPEDGTALDHERHRIFRLTQIVESVGDFVAWAGTKHVAAEEYAFSKHSSSVTKLAELGGAVRVDQLRHLRVVVPVVASEARAYFLAGRKLPPKGKKVATHLVLFNEAGAPKEWTEDMADAFLVANFFRTSFGLPGLTLAR